MNWTHALVAIVLLAVGIYLGGKYPGLLGRASGGVING